MVENKLILMLKQTNLQNQASDPLCSVWVSASAGTGKTKILTRYCDSSFQSNSLPTIGVDFNCKTILIQGKPVKLKFVRNK